MYSSTGSAQNDPSMNIDEEQLDRMASNVRRNALKEGAKAVCPFCRTRNPWSDATCVDGVLYEHFELEDSANKRPCAASGIWKLIDAG